ncbi:ComF family protein [Pseudoduganella sp. OTU4001]|uniref:ComF family protein n=1 Tax=Pseudoduganella sp. OTU4001 TaxID=3043854 RepID=UPI00313AE596
MALALAGGLLAALLPSNCVLCGAAGPTLLCPGCHEQFFRPHPPRCPICANPLPPPAAPDGASRPAALACLVPCGRCQSDRPAFDATIVAAEYALPVDRLILQLKFAGQLALARLFASLLADAVQRHDSPRPAVLCPVPLGLQRLSERGFNQSLEIARPLGKQLGIATHAQLAVRVRDTRAQSSTPHGARQANVAQVFAIPDRALVEGRHIGLVDDVMSSGQTLQELAATLKRHGAARVTNLVFARTPPNTN